MTMDQWIAQLIAGLREGRAADVAGSRAAVDASMSEALLNRAIAERLPPGGAVRDVQVRVGAGEALVTVRLERPRFIPPVTATVRIERQADLPAAPRLVLRLGLPAGLGMLAGFGASLFTTLPPGLRLEGDRLTVDLAHLLDAQELRWVLRYLGSLLVTFEPGRVRIQGSAAVE
jgi:hypothetical protein